MTKGSGVPAALHGHGEVGHAEVADGFVDEETADVIVQQHRVITGVNPGGLEQLAADPGLVPKQIPPVFQMMDAGGAPHGHTDTLPAPAVLGVDFPFDAQGELILPDLGSLGVHIVLFAVGFAIGQPGVGHGGMAGQCSGMVILDPLLFAPCRDAAGIAVQPGPDLVADGRAGRDGFAWGMPGMGMGHCGSQIFECRPGLIHVLKGGGCQVAPVGGAGQAPRVSGPGVLGGGAAAANEGGGLCFFVTQVREMGMGTGQAFEQGLEHGHLRGQRG